MSQQGPIIVISTAGRPSFASALDEARMFPVIETNWADAARAVAQTQPAAVLVAMSEEVEPGFETLAKQIAARQPYLPLIAIDPKTSLPENAIPFSHSGGSLGASDCSCFFGAISPSRSRVSADYIRKAGPGQAQFLGQFRPSQYCTPSPHMLQAPRASWGPSSRGSTC